MIVCMDLLTSVLLSCRLILIHTEQESEVPLPSTLSTVIATSTPQEAGPTGSPRPYIVSVNNIPLASTPAVTPPTLSENSQTSTSNSRTAMFASSLVFLGVGIVCSIATIVVVAILLRRRKLKKNLEPNQSTASSEEALNESLEYNYAYSGRSNQNSSLQTSQKNP